MEAVEREQEQATEVYVLKERVKIVKEVGNDFLIEDLATGRQYLVDKTYFKRHYVTEAELVPIHNELWEKLNKQAKELHQLKKANTRLRKELRSVRRENDKLRKDKPEQQHYRNGRKRGRTMNG